MIKTLKEKGLWIIPIICACGFFLSNLLVQSFFKLTLSDFHVYNYVANAVFKYHTNPYSNFTPIYPYFFPPASLILFYPITVLPFYLSKIVFTLINAVLLLVSLFLINKSVLGKNTWHFWLILLLSLIFYPLVFTFRDGQFNVIMLFIYSLGLYSLTHKNLILAGLGLGIGVFTKISPALIVLYALVKKRFKLVILCALTVITFSFLAELFVFKNVNYYYVKNIVSKVSNQSGGFGWTDQSILAFLKRANFELGKPLNNKFVGYASYAFVGLVLSLFVIVDFKSKKGKYNTIIDYLILTTIGVVGTGLSWYHQYTILLLPLFGSFLLVYEFIKTKKALFLSILTFVYILWCFNLKPAKFLIGFFQFEMLYGALILLALLFYFKANQHLFNEEGKYVNEELLNKKIMYGVFILFLIIGFAPWNIRQNLKEGRDKARVEAINYMGKTLKNSQAVYKIGESNSFIGSNKIGKGYILFEKGEQNKVSGNMSILYIDPINNSNYNYVFSSNDKYNFNLKAKLESTKYINRYGNYYEYKR